jgi:hypothetical protein
VIEIEGRPVNRKGDAMDTLLKAFRAYIDDYVKANARDGATVL